MLLHGHCHCENVRYELQTETMPADMTLRICRCDFCLRHRPRYWSDPAGSVSLNVSEPQEVVAYRFGHGTADFLLCGRCGVFCCAITQIEDKTLAVINMNLALKRDDVPAETFIEALDENAEQRTARRLATWTPVTSVWPLSR